MPTLPLTQPEWLTGPARTLFPAAFGLWPVWSVVAGSVVLIAGSIAVGGAMQTIDHRLPKHCKRWLPSMHEHVETASGATRAGRTGIVAGVIGYNILGLFYTGAALYLVLSCWIYVIRLLRIVVG